MFGEKEISNIIESLKKAIRCAISRDEKRELQEELAYYTSELAGYSSGYPACTC